MYYFENVLDENQYEYVTNKTLYGNRWKFDGTSTSFNPVKFWYMELIDDPFFTENFLKRIEQPKTDDSYLFIMELMQLILDSESYFFSSIYIKAKHTTKMSWYIRFVQSLNNDKKKKFFNEIYDSMSNAFKQNKNKKKISNKINKSILEGRMISISEKNTYNKYTNSETYNLSLAKKYRK